ncbi:hypothetical protein GE09DRAFT_1277175 [Coniochaeta sp. 2T2.1]|nr:hypothetical protein GE09DRAFT_1277175 [Coniochaeta sp. 2T2.1]
MSMLKSRLLPLAGVAGLGALFWSQTSGGGQAPKTHASKPADQQAPVSETFQAIGSQGGKNTTDSGPGDYDPKDTRLYSRSPDAQSKKNPDKHIGDRGSHLPWKRGEGGKGA